MIFDYDILDETEKINFALRSLYKSFDYKQYRMSKFEEYDLYSRNKDFLVSDSVITFTDTNGKLMALKPDVTLSLIKNSKDLPDEVQKLCYSENVYRISRRTGSFKEIMQAGLEYFGKVDAEGVREVLKLALRSLETVGKESVLTVADLDILSVFADEITDNEEAKERIWKCIGEKNLHGISEVLKEFGIPEEKAATLKELLKIYGTPAEALPKLVALTKGTDAEARVKALSDYVTPLASEGNIVIDFSLTGDIKYYNGIIFKGYIAGIPESVLSGGEYDKLMKRMGRKSGAIGFAVYLDLLERVEVAE